MNRRPILVIALLLAVLMGCAALLLAPAVHRPCGHKESLLARRYPQWFAPHSCIARQVVNTLHKLHDGGGEKMLVNGKVPRARWHGRGYPSPVNMWDDMEFALSSSYTTFTGTGPLWQVHLEKRPHLAGYYLMTADGVVHFSADHPATLEDGILPR